MSDDALPTLPADVYLVRGASGPPNANGSGSISGWSSDAITTLPMPGDRLVVDVAGESIVVVRDDAATSCAAFYNVCRHRGAELVDPVRAGVRLVRVGRSGARTTPGPTASTAGSDGPRSWPPTTPPNMSLHSVAVDVWGGFVFVNLNPDAARPLLDQLRSVPGPPPSLSARRAAARPDVPVRGRRQLEGASPRTTTSATTADPVHPTLCDLVPAFRRGGSGSSGPDGIPHRRGGVDIHDHRHLEPGAVRRPRRRRAQPAQGRAGLPEPAAQPVGRARRRLPARAARADPDDGRVRPAASIRTRFRGPRSTHTTPATSGTRSTGRTGRSARACSAACHLGRGPAAGSRRWRTTLLTSPAGTAPRWAMPSEAVSASPSSDSAGSDPPLPTGWPVRVST